MHTCLTLTHNHCSCAAEIIDMKLCQKISLRMRSFDALSSDHLFSVENNDMDGVSHGFVSRLVTPPHPALSSLPELRSARTVSCLTI